MAIENISELLQYGERINLECKKAQDAVPAAVWETYSAFANTNGGIILLGIKENLTEPDPNKRFSPTNISNPGKLIHDFWNTINNRSKVNINILVDSNVGTALYKGCTVIWIEVPPANYKQRPIYINNNLLNGTYKRNFEGDYHCTEEEVKAMLRDANVSGNDSTILDGYTMDDIDPETLKAYRIKFELQNPDHVDNGLDNENFLRQLGGYAVDRTTKREGLTTAGLLMFGKGLPIRDRFDNFRMDYIDKTNLMPNSRWSDRLTYDGTWENNLYSFFTRVVPKLVSDIKRPFRLEGMTRIDDTPVHKAIREAVVNMMIHSDYLINGVLKIEKNDDGFLFSNPGNLKLPILAIYEGNHSVARNPKIQTFFRMIGLGDNIGSGFPTILSAWGEENWRKPDLSENLDLHEVNLRLLTISLMPPECSEFLQKHFGKAYSELSNEEQIILGTAFLEKGVCNTRLQTILNLHSTAVGKHLSHLVEREMLIVNARGRWTTYAINEDYVPDPDQTSFDLNHSAYDLLNETDKAIYDYIRANGFITTKMITEITRISSLQGANIAVARLVDKKLIKRVPKGKINIYELV